MFEGLAIALSFPSGKSLQQNERSAKNVETVIYENIYKKCTNTMSNQFVTISLCFFYGDYLLLVNTEYLNLLEPLSQIINSVHNPSLSEVRPWERYKDLITTVAIPVIQQ